jgi:hypothetical protein
MDLQLTARILLTIFCFVQGLATVLLDLNRTHAAHPQWLGHARFHVVWQTVTVAVMATIEVGLLWLPGPLVSERFYLVALLACAPMAGFFGALVSRRIYGGTLSDPGGIPPLRLRISGRDVQVDMNLVAEIAGIITVMVLVGLFHFSGVRG